MTDRVPLWGNWRNRNRRLCWGFSVVLTGEAEDPLVIIGFVCGRSVTVSSVRQHSHLYDDIDTAPTQYDLLWDFTTQPVAHFIGSLLLKEQARIGLPSTHDVERGRDILSSLSKHWIRLCYQFGLARCFRGSHFLASVKENGVAIEGMTEVCFLLSAVSGAHWTEA